MSYLLNNQQKLNDVIFENRNKNYGAYAIRSCYGATVLKSISYMLVGVGSFMYIAFYVSNKRNDDPNRAVGQVMIPDCVFVIPFDSKPNEEILENKKEENKPPLKKKEIIPEISSFKIIDSLASPTSEIKSTIVSSSTTSIFSTSGGSDTISNSSEKSTLNETTGGTKEKTKLLYQVDTQPEFEGGLSALQRFVRSQLRYPNVASEEGKSGIVYVQFVVDEFGKVGYITRQNTAGYGMDEEALRVVALIPKFKTPAKVKGEAVKVYFQLPIKFVLR